MINIGPGRSDPKCTHADCDPPKPAIYVSDDGQPYLSFRCEEHYRLGVARYGSTYERNFREIDNSEGGAS